MVDRIYSSKQKRFRRDMNWKPKELCREDLNLSDECTAAARLNSQFASQPSRERAQLWLSEFFPCCCFAIEKSHIEPI